MLEKVPRAKEFPLIYKALPSILRSYADYFEGDINQSVFLVEKKVIFN
jgi:hypothetical protein